VGYKNILFINFNIDILYGMSSSIMKIFAYIIHLFMLIFLLLLMFFCLRL